MDYARRVAFLCNCSHQRAQAIYTGCYAVPEKNTGPSHSEISYRDTKFWHSKNLWIPRRKMPFLNSEQIILRVVINTYLKLYLLWKAFSFDRHSVLVNHLGFYDVIHVNTMSIKLTESPRLWLAFERGKLLTNIKVYFCLLKLLIRCLF